MDQIQLHTPDPVKHGYVRRLEDWPYSSYSYHLRTRGAEWLYDCLVRYPVVDYLAEDGFAADEDLPCRDAGG